MTARLLVLAESATIRAREVSVGVRRRHLRRDQRLGRLYHVVASLYMRLRYPSHCPDCDAAYRYRHHCAVSR